MACGGNGYTKGTETEVSFYRREPRLPRPERGERARLEALAVHYTKWSELLYSMSWKGGAVSGMMAADRDTLRFKTKPIHSIQPK